MTAAASGDAHHLAPAHRGLGHREAAEPVGATRALPSSMGPRPRVLLAEDDTDLRCAMADALRADGIDVIDVPDGADVRSYMDDCVLMDLPKPRIHVLVTDLSMPQLSGPRLLDHLDELGHALPTVVVTGMDRETAERVARRPSVLAVLRKPLDLDRLLAVLHAALGAEDSRQRWQ